MRGNESIVVCFFAEDYNILNIVPPFFLFDCFINIFVGCNVLYFIASMFLCSKIIIIVVSKSIDESFE